MRRVGRVQEYDPQAPKGLLLNALSWTARRRPVTWFLVNVGNKIDPYLMRASGGRLKTTLVAPTVLLTHTGAKSGQKRTTPLAYFNDGEDVVLIASRGGHRDHPAWYHNLVANPEVELWSKGGGGRYRAKEAQGRDRERLWALATGFYPGFAQYQERAGDRRIPVIVCVPQD
jgi:deazaflavin-dependent oxidoreductase (nitroreductase family)